MILTISHASQQNRPPDPPALPWRYTLLPGGTLVQQFPKVELLVLRIRRRSPDGSYTTSHYLRSGKFDLLKYEDQRAELQLPPIPTSACHK